MSTLCLILLVGMVGLILAMKALGFDLIFLSKPTGNNATVLEFNLRYRPMQRLLDQRDLAFYGSHPSSAGVGLWNLRRKRIQLFRRYLRLLMNDFSCSLGELESLMVDSSFDRPDLAKTIQKSRLYFAKNILRVEAELLLYRYGIGHVDVSSLVTTLCGLHSLRMQYGLPQFA